MDFGASDKPLKPDVLTTNGLMQFPTVVGGIVPVVNLPGVGPGQLHVTGRVLADIYRGVDLYWDAPVIKAFNPGVKLPHMKITVVHRARTVQARRSFSPVSCRCRRRIGPPTSAPTTPLTGRSESAARATMASPPMSSRSRASIGYVEYAYAKQNHLTYALMQNRSGAWVSPDAGNFAAAAGRR